MDTPSRVAHYLAVLAFIGSLFALGIAIATRIATDADPPPRPNPRASLFHVPPGGCPAGTVTKPDAFRRGGRAWVAGCLNPHGDGSIDFLEPGESSTIPAEIVERLPRS